MNINYRNCAGRLAGCLAIASTSLIPQARALDVINPTGASYVNVSDSSHYDGSYVSANLFNQDLTGVAVGASIPGAEFAKSGSGDSFVAFQLDTVYTNVGSIFYAQRNGSDPSADKVGIISIWSSTSAPFTAADPGTAPQSNVAITNTTGAQWTEYLMTNAVSGQYFLLKLHQNTASGNPGGTELRLGAVLGIAPSVVTGLTDKTVYSGGTARFSASVTGTAPLVFSWKLGSTVLVNGSRIFGATTNSLVVSNIVTGDAGTYTLTVSNSSGVTNITANLTVINSPTNAAEAAVLSLGPLAFWQLNEPTGSSLAFDYVGSFNGTYGGSSGVAASGPQSPAYPGFSSTNTALQTYAFTIASAVTLPPVNVVPTDSKTILAWIYQDGSAGPQQPYTGIVYCRGSAGQTSAGLICSGDGTQLAYQWGGNRYNFASGLVLPTNQWALVALVYTTNATTLYCGTSNGIVLSAVDNFANGGQAFEANMWIGLDPDAGESSRTFNGVIDDVAFFNRALSSSDINAIYQAGTGIVPTLQIVGQSATNITVYQAQPINLSVQVSGLNPKYQWFKQTAPIAGATNSAFAIASAKVSDSGNYYVVVSNQVNSVTSAIVTVTVPTYVILPIGPTGTNYTVISESSDYPDPNYVGTNMFDTDLTSVRIGNHVPGKDWADDGYGLAFQPAYLAFQLDKIYSASAILYAQRNSQSGQTIDKVTMISIWASQTTPFTAADPGSTPDAVISTPEVDAAILHGYILPSAITGQYFVIKVEQDPTVYGSNIGGDEFRLASKVTPVLLTYSNSLAGLTLYWPAQATLQQADDAKGPYITATNVTSGVPFATTAAKRFYRILY